MAARIVSLTVLAVIAAASLLIAFATGREQADASEAERVALEWTGAELDGPPRRDGDSWEIDVRRANGSIVEVGLGPEFELRELDEEAGAGGTVAHDELAGAARVRAVAAARSASGPGQVRSVEREGDGSIEVNVLSDDQGVVEVELDRRLHVTDVDEEAPADE